VAAYVDRILKSEKPADLPVQGADEVSTAATQGDRGIIMSALLTAVPFLTSITTKECGLGIANESQAEA